MLSTSKRIFISYAWESITHKDEVWELARWLQTNSGGNVNVIIDRLHENRPPVQGWPAWMQQEVKKADIVLIICSALYKKRFQKEDYNVESGAGVNFEGAIITQELYNIKLQNNKFFPVLPDGGDRNNIPSILQAFDNNHGFPSGNERILKLIFDDNPKLFKEISEILEVELSEIKNGELEKEIVNVIIDNLKNDGSKSEKIMLTPIQIIVRTFLLLSESSKIEIIRKLNIFDSALIDMRPSDRDKAIFKLVKENNLLHELWEQVNAFKPFEDINNPF